MATHNISKNLTRRHVVAGVASATPALLAGAALSAGAATAEGTTMNAITKIVSADPAIPAPQDQDAPLRALWAEWQRQHRITETAHGRWQDMEERALERVPNRFGVEAIHHDLTDTPGPRFSALCVLESGFDRGVKFFKSIEASSMDEAATIARQMARDSHEAADKAHAEAYAAFDVDALDAAHSAQEHELFAIEDHIKATPANSVYGVALKLALDVPHLSDDDPAAIRSAYADLSRMAGIDFVSAMSSISAEVRASNP